MKKVAGLSLLFLLAQNMFASTLIFRTVLDTKAGLLSETPKLNTENFKQIRVYIKKETKSARGEEEPFFANIYAIEEEQELPLLAIDKTYTIFNALIDTPSPITKISVQGQGKFYIYVWASR